ncbi:MAG: hypothetical protein ABI836_02695 [Gemmatimonadota bacterium]
MADDNSTKRRTDVPDANRDPLSGAPGAHPIGTGVGAAGGAAAGAAIGTMGGPVGAVVGGAIGAVAGGLAGKGAAEAVNPTVEEAYWRDNFSGRPYVDQGASFDEYGPAYRYGWESHPHYIGSSFDDVETDLGREWDRARGASTLGWDQARHATRDAWHRIEEALPGDADGDGR